MKKLLTALLLLVSVNANAQAPVPAPQVLRYENNKLAWDIVAGSLNEAQGYKYKLYGGTPTPTTAREITGFICAPTASLNNFHCEAPSVEFTIGSNVLEMTAVNGVNTESPKSTALLLFYATAVKETIVNTEKQSILRCQPGSYEVIRITEAAKLLPAYNNTTKHVAYSYATAAAVYIVTCTLMESGT